jgi:hypothetical protein
MVVAPCDSSIILYSTCTIMPVQKPNYHAHPSTAKFRAEHVSGLQDQDTSITGTHYPVLRYSTYGTGYSTVQSEYSTK